MNMYQVLRAIQAVLALAGILLCARNLLDARGDVAWLREHHINGLRQLTANAAVHATMGRLAAVVLLGIIGLWGSLVPGDFSDARRLFETVETWLEVFVVSVVLYVAWQTHRSRREIIAWRADNTEDTDAR